MIYLDNAATTPVLKEVADTIHQSLLENYGNPSSTHQSGRKAKASIELVRKNIAKQFQVSSNEIIFTSGATEGINMILTNAVEKLDVKHFISSKIEHHAVLHTIQKLEEKHKIKVSYVQLNENGEIDLNHLEKLVTYPEKCLVSLMYLNNEIGNLNPISKIANICKNNSALFHSDTVQAIGHYELNLQDTPIDFITASGHKFHGPKGIGFIYVKKGLKMSPVIFGGGQEKGMRSGTENVSSILGLGKAFEMAYTGIRKNQEYQKELKKLLISELKKHNSDIKFNGFSSDLEKSSHHILSIRLPKEDKMLLFHLDLKGLAVSGGSACQSGANKGSHVLHEILSKKESQKTSIRISLSHLNTKEEILEAIKILKEII